MIFIYSNELVCNILKYINININTEITIINLSNIFSYDKTYIMKKFKRELGLTIVEYINNKRILNSLSSYRLNTTILRIALLNGYNSIEYYSEIFRNLVGVSPRVYKRFITPLNNLNEEETNTIRNSISNLINIYAALTNESVHEVEILFENANYGEFKRAVADKVCELLIDIQSKYNKLVDSEEVDEILRNGANKVRVLAKEKFEIMKKEIGLYR